jgi:glycosyltransferase involved in cell wall biosynthesis
MDKVALITAHGWVGVSTPVIMTAKYLAQQGYFVDLYLDEDSFCDQMGINRPSFRESNINVITVSRDHLNLDNIHDSWLPANDTNFVRKVVEKQSNYKWMVGFDIHGLIRAAILSECWNVPFIYHSLEIEEPVHPLKKLEIEFSNNALITITQDEQRADILSNFNKLPRNKLAVIHNSTLGGINPVKYDYFRELFAIPKESIIVLATGTLLPITCIDQLLNTVDMWPKSFVLVLNGWIPDHSFKNFVYKKLDELAGRVFLNTKILPIDHKNIIFQSVDIGLVLFTEYDTNLKYAAGSAGKLYDFMQAGVPIIGNDIPGMHDLIVNNGIGKVVSSISDIGTSLIDVFNEYSIFKQNAFNCFGNYRFEDSYNNLLNLISSILNKEDVMQKILKYDPGALSNSCNTMKFDSASLVAEARFNITNNNIPAAFDLLNKAKALKQPEQDIDLLRAHCFLKMNQLQAAIQALYEELRYFPENSAAKELLNQLVGQQSSVGSLTGAEPEFIELLQVIRPYTMLSEQRLYSLYRLARHVCENNIPGNFVECGVAAGGSSALLAWVIKKYSSQPRRLFAFDSFSGMPAPTAADSHHGLDAESSGWGSGTCAAPETSVREVCSKLSVEELLVTVKGNFEETLPKMANWVGMIAFLHLDGDWYESTKAILDNLYGQLSNHAMLQVDDYGYWEGCRKALHEFEANRSLKFELNAIDGTGVWFEKPDCFPVSPAIPSTIVAEFLEDDPVPQGIITQMSANERFQLYYTVRSLKIDRARLFRFVEIGSYGGGSLLLICRALQRSGVSYQGVSVEPGGTPQFKRVLEMLGDKVIHLPMFSHQTAERLALLFTDTQKPGFILVDGDHSYQGVRQDILDFYPMLAAGGTMLFHDYLPPLDARNREFIYAHHANTEPGIRQACHEVLESGYGLQPVELPLLYPNDPTQTQAQLPIIPGVFSTIRAYVKTAE